MRWPATARDTMDSDPLFPGPEWIAADATSPIVHLSEFLQSPPGRYVLAWEQQHLDRAVADIFGYHALQLGLPEIDALRENRMPLRICGSDRRVTADAAAQSPPRARGTNGADGLNAGPCAAHESPANGLSAGPSELSSTRAAGAPAHSNGDLQVAVIHRYEELPFAANSIDLVVLPHILEFAEEPHQVLREVDRVLVPEGQVVITGFNPASLWGLRQSLTRLGARPFLPRSGHFIALPRIKDWLQLLSFEVNRGRFGCYTPWARSEAWLRRWSALGKAGDGWWPLLGSIYMVTAVKRVRGMRLIGAIRKRKEYRAPGLAPSATRTMRVTGDAYSIEREDLDGAANETMRNAARG